MTTLRTSLLALLALLSMGATYYVDPNAADDTGAGTLASPWKYVKPHTSALTTGDKMFLRGGTYNATTQTAANMQDISFSTATTCTLMTMPGERAVFDYTGLSTRGWLIGTADTDCVLKDIVFQNFSATVDFLYVNAADGFTLEDCDFISIDGQSTGMCVRVRNSGTDQALRFTARRCRFYGHPAGDNKARLIFDQTDVNAYDQFLVEGCQFNQASDVSGNPNGHSGGIVATQIDSLIIRDCTFYNAGNDIAESGNGLDAIQLQNCDRVWISDIYFQRWNFGLSDTDHMHNTDFLSAGAWSGAYCDTVHLANSYVYGAGHGVQFASATGLGQLGFVTDCVFDSTYDDAVFYYDTFQKGAITRVLSHHAGDNGFDVKGDYITVDHCTIVRADAAALAVMGDYCIVTNNLVYDSRTAGYVAQHGLTTAPVGTRWLNNIYYDPQDATGATAFYDITAAQSWANWQADGRDKFGKYGSPGLKNAAGLGRPRWPSALNITCGSIALDAGTDGAHCGAYLFPADAWTFHTADATAVSVDVYTPGGQLSDQDSSLVFLDGLATESVCVSEAGQWLAVFRDASGTAVDVQDAEVAPTAAQVADAVDLEVLDANVVSMAANTMTATALAADAATEIADAVDLETIDANVVSMAADVITSTVVATNAIGTAELNASSEIGDAVRLSLGWDSGSPPAGSLQEKMTELRTNVIDIETDLLDGVPATTIGVNGITASSLAADVGAELADATWDEARAGHTTAGTFGEGVTSVQGNVTGSTASVTTPVDLATAAMDADALDPTASAELNLYLESQHGTGSWQAGGDPAATADAVWDELRSGHTGVGSFGEGMASVQGNVTGSTASVTAPVSVAAASITAIETELTNGGNPQPWSGATAADIEAELTDNGNTQPWNAAATDIDSVRAVGIAWETDLFRTGTGTVAVDFTFKNQTTLAFVDFVNFVVQETAPVVAEVINVVVPGHVLNANLDPGASYSWTAWRWGYTHAQGTFVVSAGGDDLTLFIDPVSIPPSTDPELVTMFLYTIDWHGELVDSLEVFVRPQGENPAVDGMLLDESSASVGLTDGSGVCSFELPKSKFITADGSDPYRSRWEVRLKDKRANQLYGEKVIRNVESPDSTTANVYWNYD